MVSFCCVKRYPNDKVIYYVLYCVVFTLLGMSRWRDKLEKTFNLNGSVSVVIASHGPYPI